jgi:PEP-CTERM motif
MTRKLIVLFSVCTLLCLIAAPATASLMVQVQPTLLDGAPVDHGLTSLDVVAGDVVTFQILGTISTGLSTDGLVKATGSLAQILGTGGVWNTQVKGTFSPVTFSTEFTNALNTPGTTGVDIGGDGFTLDIGSTGTSASGYIAANIFNASTGGARSANPDVLGTFTYTVGQVNAASQTGTNIYWQARSAGSKTGFASWYENGTLVDPSTTGVYTGGSAQAVTLHVLAPEPSVLIMFVMGALGLLAIRRRK